MGEDNKKKGRESEKKDQAEFPTLSNIEPVEEIGSQIGPYKLLSILGEGGMGLVYLADQKEPVKRRVALKIIKPGMDSRQVIGRFEQERQALAMLDHPNIAHIYDGGTTKADHPYFVMEYVKGSPITKYCDKKELNIERRLELFEQVCEAVQHAHQKGIIHRDLKPSNILVQERDGKPVPMIIDFGIAKATQPLTERTIVTKLSEPIGTLEYMSPEQAEMTIHGIDTRSDIYSLGVVLYELLTGILPFTSEELEKAGRAEIQRIIRETDPPHPSTRLSSLGDEAQKIAQCRQTEVFALAKRLHKELEWIPLKAMRKEPDRRYKTASEFADDVRNYLNGDPLMAGPESRTYRLKKTIKRHRVVVSFVALVMFVLVTGIVVSTAMYIEIKRAKIYAEQKATEAEGLLKEKKQALVKVEQALNRAKKAEENARKQFKLAKEAQKTIEEQHRLAEKRLYLARIGLAQQAWKNGNVAEMISLLNSLRPEPGQNDLRGFEWYYLLKLSRVYYKVFNGHDQAVACLAFSPSGDILASGSYDKTIRFWDPKNGQLKLTRANPHFVRSLAFSPDGKILTTGCEDGSVKLWDMINKQELETLSVKDSVSSVKFSPDGKKLAAGFKGQIMLWHLTDSKWKGSPISEQVYPSGVTVVSFSPDSNILAIGGGGFNRPCDIKLWNIKTNRICGILQGHTSQIRDIEFSPDGKILASASHDRTVKLWDPCTAEVLAVGKGHNSSLWDVTFSADGQHLATSGSDHTIIVWDTTIPGDTKLKELYRLKGHTGRVTCLAFSPDGKKIASASNDTTIKLWDIETYEKGINRLLHDSAVYCLAFSRDDRILVTGSKNGDVVLWDSATEQKIDELEGHSGPVWTMNISNDGKIVATGSSDKTVKLWDINNGNLINEIYDFTNEIYSIAFSPDDKFLAVGCKDTSLSIWDISKKKKEPVTKPRKWEGLVNLRPESTIEFSPDGNLLAAGGLYFGTYGPVLWNIATKSQLDRPLGYFEVTSVTFSQNGKMLAAASGGADTTIKLLDPGTGQLVKTLRGHSGSVLSVDFSPNGKILVSGSDDNTVRIWDINSSDEQAIRAVLNGHTDSITSVAFSSDGNILASASTDKSVILWRAATPAEAER